MNKLLARFLTIFIPSKKKRHEFRQKYITKKTIYVSLNDIDKNEIISRFDNIIDMLSRLNQMNKANQLDLSNQINNQFDQLKQINKTNQADSLNQINNQFNQFNQVNLSTFNLHQKTFPRFKNINQGKDVVLLASGPTLRQYKPLENVINVGVNRSFQGTSEKFDYIFIQDYSGQTKSYIKKLNNYNKDTCIKFYGIASELNPYMQIIPESEAIEANALRYRTDCLNFDSPYNIHFAYDIASQPLGDGKSIVFSAMQFILWTHPKRIYLVGCDCSLGGYFNNERLNEKEKQNYLNTVEIIENWKKLKFFANRYYPDTEIISINPVGLKGIFKDIYQE